MLEDYVFYDVSSLNEFVAYLRSQIWSILLRGIPLTIILLVIPVIIKLVKYFIFQAQTSSFEIHLRNSMFKTWLRKRHPELVNKYMNSKNKQRFQADYFRNRLKNRHSNSDEIDSNPKFHNTSKRFRTKLPYKSFTLNNDIKYHSKVISKAYPYRYNPNRVSGSNSGVKRYRSSVPYGNYKNRAYPSRSNAGYENYSHVANRTSSNFSEPIQNKSRKPYAKDPQSYGVPIENPTAHVRRHNIDIEYSDNYSEDFVGTKSVGNVDIPLENSNHSRSDTPYNDRKDKRKKVIK